MRTFSISAPTRSATAASSFIKLILVASIALAAYLVNSAERKSMTTKRSWLRVNGSYNARIISVVRVLSVANHDAIGSHEILNGCSFLEEFWIRDHVELDREIAG